MKSFLLLLCTGFILLIACNEQTTSQNSLTSSEEKDTVSCPPGSSKLDISKIEQITGMKGSEKNGKYKITVLQHDLSIIVDGFKITPPMGLGSWAVFTPCADSAMVMGDIIVTEMI